MKIILSKSQIETLQTVLADDYCECRMRESINKGTIQHSWFMRLLRLGKSIHQQTGIESQVQSIHDNWVN
jgi:hypothetical protein